MSTWKVILATLVIFAAGVVTGGLLVKNTKKNRVKEPPVMRVEMLKRLTRSLDLTQEQRAKIAQILQESTERTRILNEVLEPERRAETRKTVDAIRAELTPPQRARFDELLRQKRKGGGGEKRRPSAPSNSVPVGTNLAQAGTNQ